MLTSTLRFRMERIIKSADVLLKSNETTELDEGNPQELGLRYLDLMRSLENLNVLGGCCGTDHRHVAEICKVFVNKR